jgi:antitoxin HicB
MSKHIGSTLESLLEEMGEKDDVELLANKKAVADALLRRMKALKVTSSALATRMKTSRNQVHRLLDPHETGVTFKSIDRASRALGLKLEITLAPPRARATTAHGHGTPTAKLFSARKRQAKR